MIVNRISLVCFAAITTVGLSSLICAAALADCSRDIASHEWKVVWSQTQNYQSASVLEIAPVAATCFLSLAKSDSGSAHYSDVVSAVDMFVAIAIANDRLGNMAGSHHAAAAALALLDGIQNDRTGSRLAQKYALDDRNTSQMLLMLPSTGSPR
jgi:hypothetical protein